LPDSSTPFVEVAVENGNIKSMTLSQAAEFVAGDECNPRNWAVKKKGLVGAFTIISAFVA
jgi:hypothetical protein